MVRLELGYDSCMNCRFWAHVDHHVEHGAEPLAHWGTCRRYPPTTWERSSSDTGFGFSSDTPYGQPTTDGADWCGEHQKDG
jgi:hypothetical protein